MASKGLIPYSKNISLDLCDYCLFGKKHRVSFGKTSKVMPNVLDFVYSDVCVPMEVHTLGGNRYFIMFIDVASRKFGSIC